MPRLSFVLSVAGMTSVLCIAASCFQDSCACVTVPATREEHWIGVTATRDSLDLSLTVGVGVATTTAGSGHVKISNGSQQSISVNGAYDGLSPSSLTIGGWFATPVTWARTTARSDSLYGIVHLPPFTRPGDTLGLSLYRRR